VLDNIELCEGCNEVIVRPTCQNNMFYAGSTRDIITFSACSTRSQ